MPRKPKKFHFIYKTECKTTGKFYIGMHSTDNLNDGYIGSGKILRRSIAKHGREDHVLSILLFCNNRTELKFQEKMIVNEDLLKDEFCMNLKQGGEGGSDSNSLSAESRLKISLANKGKGHKNWSDFSKSKLSQYRTGRKNSEETKLKISIANTGKKRSEEFKAKVSETLKRNSEQIAERQRAAISGRHFYNNGVKTILTFDTDKRLLDTIWKKGKL
jgi:hypothetical protein